MSNDKIALEEYWGIYNKYNALNESGMDIAGECQAAVQAVMDKFHQYNPRDINLMFVDISSGEAAHRVLLRAQKMRKAEKAKKNDAPKEDMLTLTEEETK